MFVVLFLACFDIKVQAEGRYSFSDISEIESFVLEGEEFESDTLLMKNYLEKLDGNKKYRAEVVKMILMANAYDKSFDRMNERADSLYREAVKIAKENKDYSMSVWARMNFVNNRYFFREYEQITPIMLSVMNDLQTKKSIKVIFPTETYKLIGWILQTMNDAEESLYYLDKALVTAKPASEDEATLLYSIGLHHFRGKNYIKAEKYFDKAGKIALKIKDNSRYAKVLGSKAEILEIGGKISEAIPLAKEDIRLSKLANDTQNTVYALLLLARLHVKNNQPDEAKPLVAEAKEIAYNHSYFLSARRRIVMMKLELLNDHNSAEELRLLKELRILEDSVRKTDGEIAVRNSQYQIQKRKYEIDLDNTKASYRQKVNFYIILCIILLFAASFIYWSYRNKLKNRVLAYDNLVLEMELEKQKHELKLTETEFDLNSQIEYLRNKNSQIRKLNFEIQKIERSAVNYLEKKEGKLHALLESHLMTDDNWKVFKTEFQKTYPDYYENLVLNFPDLTDANLRIVLLQNLGFSYNETASLLGITPEAVRKSRQRMKKKYGKNDDALFETLFEKAEQD